MYVRLEDLVNYIGFSDSCFLNLDTYEFLEQQDLKDNTEYKLIEIPVLNDLKIREAFSNEYSKARGKYILKKIFSDENEFYFYLHKFNLVDAWDSYKHEYIADYARNWCYQNNIKFTEKDETENTQNDYEFVKSQLRGHYGI